MTYNDGSIHKLEEGDLSLLDFPMPIGIILSSIYYIQQHANSGFGGKLGKFIYFYNKGIYFFNKILAKITINVMYKQQSFFQINVT